MCSPDEGVLFLHADGVVADFCFLIQTCTLGKDKYPGSDERNCNQFSLGDICCLFRVVLMA